MRKKRWRFLFFIAAFFIGSCGKPDATDLSYLFVIWAPESTITADPADQSYRLTLKNIDSQVMVFTDRPNRKGAFCHLDQFVNQWNRGTDSFASNPPNAGIVALFKDRTGKQTDIMVTLLNPSYDEHEGTLTFNITSIDQTQVIPQGSFHKTIVFIDDESEFIGAATF